MTKVYEEQANGQYLIHRTDAIPKPVSQSILINKRRSEVIGLKEQFQYGRKSGAIKIIGSPFNTLLSQKSPQILCSEHSPKF